MQEVESLNQLHLERESFRNENPEQAKSQSKDDESVSELRKRVNNVVKLQGDMALDKGLKEVYSSRQKAE